MSPPSAKDTVIVYKTNDVSVPGDISPSITNLPPYLLGLQTQVSFKKLRIPIHECVYALP